ALQREVFLRNSSAGVAIESGNLLHGVSHAFDALHEESSSPVFDCISQRSSSKRDDGRSGCKCFAKNERARLAFKRRNDDTAGVRKETALPRKADRAEPAALSVKEGNDLLLEIALVLGIGK